MNIAIDGRAAMWYRGTGIGTYTYQLIKALKTVSSGQTQYSNNYHVLHGERHCQCFSFWDEVIVPNSLSGLGVTPDIYHVPQNGMGLPLEKSCAYMITLHDTIPMHMPETVSDRYMKIFNSNIDHILKNCDGIITVSQFSKEDIARDFNFPKDKIYVTPLASEEIYKPLPKSVAAKIMKEKYKLPSDYILYVGGFSPRKNITGAIISFSNALKSLPPETCLVIAGTKGKSYEIYKTLAQKLQISDRVLFPGFIEMKYMPWLYNAARVFIYPSFYEGFGLPPLEAMACNIPVIASHATSIPEVLGESALFFDPHDTAILTDYIIQLYKDDTLRKDLIKKGQNQCSQYSWETTAKKTMDAYNHCINNL